MMRIKISATFFGRCSICGKETKVFTAGDEDTKETVNVCESCAKKLGEMKTYDVIKEFGSKNEEAFDNGIKVDANNKRKS